MNSTPSRNGEALIAALDAAQRCQCCPDQGWYERQNTRTGPEQEQCEFCYTVEDSRFNVLERVKEFLRASRSETQTRERAAAIIERKARALTDEFCHGDTGPGGYTWSNKEAEWQVILLEELAEEIRRGS